MLLYQKKREISKKSCAIENRNDFVLFGLDFQGGDATAINLASGTAYTDKQGYDVTLTFLQESPANFVSVAAPYGTVDIDAVLTGFSLLPA